MSLLIQNGDLILPGGRIETGLDIRLRGEKIAEIGRGLSLNGDKTFTPRNARNAQLHRYAMFICATLGRRTRRRSKRADRLPRPAASRRRSVWRTRTRRSIA